MPSDISIDLKLNFVTLNLFRTQISFRFISILLAVFMMLHVLNKSFYSHTHIYNNNVITHSHPYNKAQDRSPIKNHHHSDTFLFLISYFEPVNLILVFGFFLLLLSTVHRIKPLQFHLHIAPVFFKHLSRGPPKYGRISG